MEPASLEGHSGERAEALPPIGRLVEVGGTRLFYHLAGSGGPVVVIIPGAGAIGLDYLNIFERSATRTASVLYDRAGTGWSGPATLPRTAPEVVAELHALLHTLGVAPPYLLVGHSLGGAFARHYAQHFPHEVHALLLLDPAHEELTSHYPPEVRELFAQFDGQPIPDFPPEVLALWRSVFADKFQRWPISVREAVIEKHAAAWRNGFLEGQGLEERIFDPLRRGGTLPDIPCTVLTAMGIDTSPAQSLPEELQRAVNEAKQSVNRLLAASVPQGEERTLDRATHPWMHIESEGAVIEALDELLGRVARQRLRARA
jgi:pimeloyl-ACP methyl ester carboxylesterase